MNIRRVLKIASGSVLAVALMVSTLPVLASNQDAPIPDTASGISDSSTASGDDGSLITWLVGGAVVIVVGGYFFYAKGKKKSIKPRGANQQ